MRRLAAFRRLAAAERFTLLGALAILPAMAVALRLAGLRRVQAMLARRRSRPAPLSTEDEARERARRTAWLVAAAARHGPYRATCLPVSLATQWLLARNGVPTELRLGVRKVNGRLDAHAWLEHEGLALDDAPQSERFAALEAPLASGRRRAR